MSQQLVSLIMFGAIILIVLLVHGAQTSALADPENQRVVYLEQLPKLAELTGTGRWYVEIIRQSGNAHSAWEVTGSAQAAINVALKTMRRAKIGEVGIKTNTPDRLEFYRLFHNHRGRNESKKVGGALITRISAA